MLRIKTLHFVKKIAFLFNNKTVDKTFDSVDRIVDFIICGTQKGGTSALDAYLREHPDICMANLKGDPNEGSAKEVHFFDEENNFLGKRPNYSRYHHRFNPKKSHKLIGEATPIYMYWHNAPRRIWEYNPNMKLIVLLRNPIDRAYSHWNMECSRNQENLSFWDSIQNEQERCREALPLQHRIYSYVDRGFYLEQLRRLWLYFPKNKVFIIKHEYLKNESEKALKDVCEFLEVDLFSNIKVKNIHSRPYTSTKMSHKEKSYLKFIFEYEIRSIERVLGWDCNDWLK